MARFPLVLAALLPLLFTCGALAQTLYGARATGDVVWIDRATGGAAFTMSTGVQVAAAAPLTIYVYGRQGTATHNGMTLVGSGPQALFAVDPWQAETSPAGSVTGVPTGYSIRSMAGGFVLLKHDAHTQPDLLATQSSWNLTVVGPTGRSDFDSIARSVTGAVYALGTAGGGQLCSVDPGTGAATPIGAGGGFGGDTRALAFLSDGALVACGASLRSVNTQTGVSTLIGPTGFSDIAALIVGGPECYANCDAQSGPPVLNIADFTCFLQHFFYGLPYANCDHSTSPPVLNVADFTCFLTKFASAAGCP